MILWFCDFLHEVLACRSEHGCVKSFRDPGKPTIVQSSGELEMDLWLESERGVCQCHDQKKLCEGHSRVFISLRKCFHVSTLWVDSVAPVTVHLLSGRKYNKTKQQAHVCISCPQHSGFQCLGEVFSFRVTCWLCYLNPQKLVSHFVAGSCSTDLC